jgi:Lrp/AsnC family leucine-responsive transcriptional regulator
VELSPTDRRILNVLQREGRISMVELSRRVGLSETPCARRMRQLEQSGVIQGYGARIDQTNAGLKVSAFMTVNTDQRNETDRKLFQEAVGREPRIVGCAAISGAHDFMLEVVAADMDDLSNLTLDRLLGLPTVTDVSTAVVFRWLKRDHPLPI